MSIPRQRKPDAEQANLSGPPPYRRGDRIFAVDPDNGTSYALRVERVSIAADGKYHLVAAVTSPRRVRSHLLTVTVDADGAGPGITPRPSRAEPEPGHT